MSEGIGSPERHSSGSFCSPMSRVIRYVIKQKSSLKEMEAQVLKLNIKVRETIGQSGDQSGADGKNDFMVNQWLNEAEKILKDARELQSRSKLWRCSPMNMAGRSHLSKAALQHGRRAEDMTHAISLITSEFESRKETFRGIMKALKDPQVFSVGVYGLAGIGKTDLGQRVALTSKLMRFFNWVAVVDMRTAPTIEKIQDSISEALGMSYSDHVASDIKAQRLRDTIIRRNYGLIFVDHILEGLDLEAIGIPSSEECKVLMISQNLEVLRRELDVHQSFEVGPISEEESLDLFKQEVGVGPAEQQEFSMVALEIAKKCAGVPSVVVSAARDLRKRDLPVWKTALLELKRPASAYSASGERVLTDVYKPIELSLKHLQPEELCRVFLLCGLMPDSSTQWLLRYCIGLRLINNFSTVEEACLQLQTMVGKLQAASLLLTTPSQDKFSMHDVARDAALLIASKDCRIFALHNDSSPVSWPPENCKGISLSRVYIDELPEQDWPELKFFLFDNENASLVIPDPFFERMKSLSVLDLTRIRWLSLPSSLCHLSNLRTLCLDFCELNDIAIVGELGSLEILSLYGSHITQLPRELGKLRQLLLLDLTNCSKLTVIPRGVLASLTRLEELYMGNSFTQWDVAGAGTVENKVNLEELKALRNLSSLDIHVLDPRSIPENLFTKNLKRYRVFIGEIWKWSGKNQTSRTLKLQHDTERHLGSGVAVLLKNAEDLHLDEVKGTRKNVLCRLDRDGFQLLKHLHVQNNSRILHIVHTFPNAFPTLETLLLNNLMKLQKLWHGQITGESFSRLSTLKVAGCWRLEHLFSVSLAQNLKRLKHLEICNCKKMQEIIGNDELEVDSDSLSFPELTFLKIELCPKLGSFMVEPRNRAVTETNKLREVSDEPDTTSLFDEKVAFPALEEVILFQLDSVTKIWSNSLSAVPGKLKRVVVEDCKSLVAVFPNSLAKNLLHLTELVVKSCSVASIVEKLQRPEETIVEFEFPRLVLLQLWHCPKLKSFYPETHTSRWPKMRKLDLYNCDELKIFPERSDRQTQVLSKPLFREKKVIPIFRELSLRSADLRDMGDDDIPEEVFDVLEVLELQCYHDDSMTVPHPFLERMKSVKQLNLSCSAFKELFPHTGLEDKDSLSNGLFTRIKGLRLDVLNSLEQIWKEDSGHEHPLQNLETLEVWDCNKLTSLVPSFIYLEYLTTLDVWKCKGLVNLMSSSGAKSLDQLVSLKIRECPMMVEVIESSEAEAAEEIRFNKLEHLTLDALSRLSTFSGKSKLVFPLLVEVVISRCPQLENFCRGSIKTTFLQEVWSTSDRKDNKQKYWKDSLDTTVRYLYDNKLGFNCLEYLRLSDLPELVGNWLSFSHEVVDFMNLKVLEVHNCHSLSFLLTPEVTALLAQLEKIEVKNCANMKEIITRRTGGLLGTKSLEIKLPALKTIWLECLPKLTCFSAGSFSLSCPSLSRITIKYSRSMKNFYQIHEQENENQRSGVFSGSLFTGMVLFPALEELTLSSVGIARIWPDQLPVSSFQKLKTLAVEGCDNLEFLLPSYILKFLNLLEEIQVCDCKNMERVIDGRLEQMKLDGTILPNLLFLTLKDLPKLVIFCHGNCVEFLSLAKLWIENCVNVEGFISDPTNSERIITDEAGPSNRDQQNVQPLFDDKVKLPQLERFLIRHLDKVQKIWHTELHRDSFCKLVHLRVADCHRLSSIFPDVLLSQFQKLEKIEIANCNELEVVVEHQESTSQSEVVKSVGKLVFPKAAVLELWMLPKLKCFYSLNRLTKWPSLQKVEVYGCDGVAIFASQFRSQKRKNRVQRSLFVVDKETFPILEDLKLESNEVMKKLWHGGISADYFAKLKYLNLIEFPCEAVVSLIPFMLMLPDLEKLVVCEASFKEIFPTNRHDNAKIFDRLCEIKLSNLPELSGSGGLLVPPSLVFPWLVTLEISECPHLDRLMMASTARSLSALISMSIVNCRSMTRVLDSEPGKTEEIVFEQMTSLELRGLPALTCFSLESCRVHFPGLKKEPAIRDCPKFLRSGRILTRLRSF